MMKAQFLLGAATLLFATPSFALDVERYEELVDQTVEMIESDEADTAEILRLVDELILLGMDGANGYGEEKAEYAAAMDYVASSADSMKALNLVEIETEWHEGGALKTAGFDTDALYDDDYASIYMEAVIHPATAHIAARAYELTGDEDYLEQVEFELVEIVDHFEDLED
jgi:hypothetical protein